MRHWLLLLPLLLASCAIEPTVGENNANPYRTRTPGTVLAVAPDTPNVPSYIPPSATTSTSPKRSVSFRTPDLVNELPSDREISTNSPVLSGIDDKVEEVTTVRAPY